MRRYLIAGLAASVVLAGALAFAANLGLSSLKLTTVTNELASPELPLALPGGAEVPAGTEVTAQATLTNAFTPITATGTIKYAYYTNAACSAGEIPATPSPNTLDLAGVPPPSLPVTPTEATLYYWQARYSGDGNNQPATSDCELLTVVPAAPNYLLFEEQPTDTEAGEPITPAITVKVYDEFDNFADNDDATQVTLALTNPNGAVLVGGGPVTVVDGLATFAAVSIEKAGVNYILQATSVGPLPGPGDDLLPDDSDPFDITHGPADHLIFVTQPSASPGTPANIVAGDAFTVVVRVLDEFENLVEDYDEEVTIDLEDNPGGLGDLLGDTSVNAAVGTATFAGLSIIVAADGYTLLVASGTMDDLESNAFNIIPGPPFELIFIEQPTAVPASPATLNAGSDFDVEVEVRDVHGNLLEELVAQMTLAIKPSTNTTGAVLDCAGDDQDGVAVTNGVATFEECFLDKVGSGYKLTAVLDVDPGTDLNLDSNPFHIQPGTATQLVLTDQPSETSGTQAEVVAGEAFTIAVELRDAFANLVPTDGYNVTLTLDTNPTSADLLGYAPPVMLPTTDGVATFNNLSITEASAGYKIKAKGSSPSLEVLTNFFTIIPDDPHHLAFVAQPTGNNAASEDFAIQPKVEIQDIHGNRTTSTANVTLSISAGPGAGNPGCTSNPIAAVSGTATFTGCDIDLIANGYKLTATSGSFSVETGAFNIVAGAADLLVFAIQPVGTTAGSTMATVTVRIEDAHGNLVIADDSTQVTLTLVGGTPGAVLSGAVATATDGVATFSNLSVSLAGTNYTLTASSVPSLDDEGPSDPFVIN